MLLAGIRDGRLARGWTQTELGKRIGVSASVICRYELRIAVRPRLDVVTSALDALGVQVRLEAPVASPPPPGRSDRAHAFTVAYVLRRLAPRWLSHAEVEVRAGGRRGWIDVLAFDRRARILIVFEIKTRLDDLGNALRQLQGYIVAVPSIAAALGWHPRAIVGVLVGLATAEVDIRISEAGDVFEVLPLRAPDLLGILGEADGWTGKGSSPIGGLALVDPLSKRQDWLRLPTSGGGRSQWRYADYADFVRAIEGKRIRRARRCPG